MTISQSTMRTTIGLEWRFALTTKTTDANKAIQFIVDEIIDEMIGFRGLKDTSSTKACTQYQSYVDMGTELTDMYANRIRKVILTNTANNDDDTTLDEIDYIENYIEWLSDPTDPGDRHYGEPHSYARYKDNIYLQDVPNLTTYEIEVLFEKAHPTIGVSQDILLPSHFEACIFHGCLWYVFTFAERKDGLAEKHLAIYRDLKKTKIDSYLEKPDTVDLIKSDW